MGVKTANNDTVAATARTTFTVALAGVANSGRNGFGRSFAACLPTASFQSAASGSARRIHRATAIGRRPT